MGTIPASDIVQVIPNVLNAGGSALDIVSVMLTSNSQVPIGVVQPFSNPSDVSDYFGPGSDELTAANNYFLGFDNSSVKPGQIKFAQYNKHKVSAYLRGGDVSALTLSQLQAVTGVLTITIDGFQYVTGSPIDLSGATSFSDAAATIQTDLDAIAPAGASFTGHIGSAPPGNNVLFVTAISAGTIVTGAVLAGASVAAGTIITGQISGSPGGVGDYSVSISQLVSSEAMTTLTTGPTVSYDSISGGFVITSSTSGAGSTMGFGSNTFATGLKLTQAGGAVTSQGAPGADPEGFMDSLVLIDQDWATFMTIFDPDSGPGVNTNKLLFAAWTNDQNNRYGYVAWDADQAPLTTVPAVASFGYLLKQSNSSGTWPQSCPDFTKAAMVCGTAGSIDYTETNGRITFKFKSQTGQVPDVTDQTTANNLRANGYNFYGSWATANQKFQGLADGTVSGPFQWFDTYIDQIWLNAALQLALMNLLFIVKSIPYTQAGYNLMEAACADPINAALNAGVIRAGVTLSAQQIAEINNSAGASVSDTIQQVGWYLQIQDASPQVRQARQSPPAKLWYTDGESVHDIDLDSIAIQ